MWRIGAVFGRGRGGVADGPDLAGRTRLEEPEREVDGADQDALEAGDHSADAAGGRQLAGTAAFGERGRARCEQQRAAASQE